MASGQTGPGLRVSDANCRPGEHAVSGGYVMREVNFATVTEQWGLPIPFAEADTDWMAGRHQRRRAPKRVTAYVICVPD